MDRKTEVGFFLPLTELLLGPVFICPPPNKVNILQSDEGTETFSSTVCTVCHTKEGTACLERKLGLSSPVRP